MEWKAFFSLEENRVSPEELLESLSYIGNTLLTLSYLLLGLTDLNLVPTSCLLCARQ